MAQSYPLGLGGTPRSKLEKGRIFRTDRHRGAVMIRLDLAKIRTLDFQPAEDFPADDVGYGFDNIGDVLAVSPLLLEKYLSAAETIAPCQLTRRSLL